MTINLFHLRGGVKLAVGVLVAILLSSVLMSCSTGSGEVDLSGNSGRLYERGVIFFQSGKYEEARKTFETILEEHPYSNYTLDAQLSLADLLYRIEETEEAASYYASFVTMHPGHSKAPYALFQKGMSYFKGVLSVDRDQKTTRKALFAFEDLVAEYPESQYAEKSHKLIVFLRERLANREFYIGNFNYKNKNYKGALSRFANILEKYPDCAIVDKTLYYIIRSYHKLGESERARDTYSTLLSTYPESSYCKDAKKYNLDG